MKPTTEKITAQRVVAALEAIHAAFMDERAPADDDKTVVLDIDFHSLLAEGEHDPCMRDIVWFEEVREEGDDEDEVEQKARGILSEGTSDWCIRSFDIAFSDGRELGICWLECWGHGMIANVPGMQIGDDRYSAIDDMLDGLAVVVGEEKDEFYACVSVEEIASFVDKSQKSST